MILTLIEKEQIFTFSLPQKVSGRYWLHDLDEQGHPRAVADAEGIQGTWRLHGSPVLAVLDEQGQETASRELSGKIQVVNLKLRKEQKNIQLLIEPLTEDRQQFQAYHVAESCRLNIGRAEDNQLIFRNPYVSSHHACLVWQNQQWSITDTQSSNGTFVNEKRVVTSPLQPGDTVYIMGLKIIVGNGFFSLNSPDGAVQLHTGAVQSQRLGEPAALPPDYIAYSGMEHFFRSPRIYKQVVKEELRIDPPPAPQRPQEIPLALLMGPALTMAMTAVVTGTVAVVNMTAGNATLLSTVPSLVMAFSMLCGTLLWPPLTRRHEKKGRVRAEQQRQLQYQEYLGEVRNRIFALGAEQKKILLENCPDVRTCEKRILERDRALWERSAGQEDFLRLRLGLGELPMAAELHFPEARFSAEEDVLRKDLLRLQNEPKTVTQVPITCSLQDTPVVGIVGDPEEVLAFGQSLLLQLAALHSYDEVKLVLLADEAALPHWERFRLLPHLWNEHRDFRYLAASGDEQKALSAALEKILAERKERASSQQANQAFMPHYVVLAAGAAPVKDMAAGSQLLSVPKELGFSCIVLASRLDELPKECALVVELRGTQSVLYNREDPSGQRTGFQPEDARQVKLEQAVTALANLSLDASGEERSMPNMLTFLELYEVGKVEHLNAFSRWKENNPVNSLQFPVGIRGDGTVFQLDLHEKFHGPHGLVAGMTGSGKSEFIITLILSMAVNYHPDEVSFILIDYKGGGLAGAFEDAEHGIRLPHLAGTITNLDGAAVNRALISIQSELRRRQAVFNEARKVSGEGTIDIYKYQNMYRSGMVSQPVPHLFIISDEFAELKAQQPEFMAQLISAARIGRSLGVHLILATQKPSGVVDDQIWSNSRFRICLKVQERADSIEMLKRPDAAELKDTGRFYLQVGFNELFSMGQSAWCGAPYCPTDRFEKKTDNGVEVLDRLGRVLAEQRPKENRTHSSGTTQVVEVVRYLSELAESEHISAQKLWLPPIPDRIYLQDLREKYHWRADPLRLNPIIGELDDPFNQAQDILTLPLSENGNVLLYGIAGSGKTTMLNTILYGLVEDYDAEHLNLYILDLGEETLQAFEAAPQVGDVLLAADEEKMQNLFKMLESELARRKKRFAEAGGDFASYCAQASEPVPHILVVLRNYAAFSEQFELLDSQLVQLTRDCAKYGIYFLMTANTTNAVRYRVSQSFGTVLALQLNDRSDYIGLFGGTDGIYPSKQKGRGICRRQRVYEFQTASFAEDSGPKAIRAAMEAKAASASCTAPPVPVLPERVTADFFPAVTAQAFPVGIGKEALRPVCLNLEKTVVTLVLVHSYAELGSTAQGLCEQLERLGNPVTVLDGAGLLSGPDGASWRCYTQDFQTPVSAVFETLLHRNHSYEDAWAAKEPLPEFEPEYVVLTGLPSILEGLPAEAKDKLLTALDRTEVEYRLRFVLCGTVRELESQTAQPWYAQQVSGCDGVWAGNNLCGQNLLKPRSVTPQMYADLPEHFGYVVKHGKPILVKLLSSRHVEEEAEDE